ncbi:hypothetical protein Taro_052081 [Colocasia esculenta]|uniref:CCHC-type domain-containing protein n=1 Tax=Colocasia esculenta TaxID=4460 RepID=A0A843XIS3_COLES|nr:hypothetical protein [Colocasia esculenta]
MQGLVQAMQTQAHTQAALQAQLEAQPSLRTRLVAFDHRTLDEALSAACRQEGEMEQYLEEKKASQKRPAATFQRQDKKKAVYPTQQRPVAVGSSQVPSVRSPGVKKECPHCGKTHGGTECWMIMGRCLKCGSSDHKIKDCPRLQQGAQRGAPAPAISGRRPYSRQYHDVNVVSASTPWTPTLIPASNDVDANLSDLHALQSPKFREQATPTIGELSPTRKRRENPSSELCKDWTLEAPIRRSKASSGVLLQLEARGNQGEGFPTTGLAPASTKNPEEWHFGGFLGQPKESFTEP